MRMNKIGLVKVITGNRLADWLLDVHAAGASPARVAFVCIGTDRSTGDSLGPLTGTLLEQAGYSRVIGTLEKPCDSANLTERLQELPPESAVIAIDSGIGSSVGGFRVSNRPVEPGKSLGKPLPPVGDYSIVGIVETNTAHPYKALQHAPLYRVWTMAHEIAAAIQVAYPVVSAAGQVEGKWDRNEH
jgi:putative sporulation protein YyaC